eukprot:524733-Pelagomonas_calceolata.AAC.1
MCNSTSGPADHEACSSSPCNRKKEKKTYVGRGNSPYINLKKGDALAQKSLESPSPWSYKKKTLMGIWRIIESTRLHNLAAR